MVVLLGRRDGPRDGVGDYCTYLGETLGLPGDQLEIVRLPVAGTRLGRGARGLRQRAENWRGCWVLLQYTALGWSRRGYPLRFFRGSRGLLEGCPSSDFLKPDRVSHH
jgi:hypothetical protein